MRRPGVRANLRAAIFLNAIGNKPINLIVYYHQLRCDCVWSSGTDNNDVRRKLVGGQLARGRHVLQEVEMRLTPLEPEIPAGEGFTEGNDIFGYREFAESLSNLVRKIDEPLVMVLDGPWGSGKSVFVKQWAELMRGKGAPVIHFDAFANDYIEDAFTAISAEIHAAASEGPDKLEKTAVDRYSKIALGVGKALVPMAIRVAARAGTAGVLSVEDVKAGSDTVKEIYRAFGEEGAKAFEGLIPTARGSDS